MRSFRFAAMGSEAHVLLPCDRGDAIAGVRELFAEWEARLSRFLPDSELSRLNAHAGEPFVVGRLLFDAIWAGVAAARATEGVFDPTLLPQLRRIGYAESFDRMPESLTAVDEAPRPGGDWRKIVLDRRSRTVVLPSGCALDLGGIAKGLAADAAIGLLKARDVGAALVSAGGDLRVLGLPPGAQAWEVLVGDDASGDVVPLVRGALATSGKHPPTLAPGRSPPSPSARFAHGRTRDERPPRSDCRRFDLRGCRGRRDGRIRTRAETRCRVPLPSTTCRSLHP